MIGIADIHLGKESDSFLVNGEPVQRVDIENRLYYVGTLCRESGEALAVLGDVFNKVNPTSAVIAAWFRFLAAFPDVQMHIIPGNHDAGVDWVNLSMVEAANLSHVHVYTSPTNVVLSDSTGSAKVSLYPHITLSERDRAISLYDLMVVDKNLVVDFAMAHGQVTDSSYENDIFFEAGDAVPLEITEIPGLVFAGHIHDQSIYRGNVAEVVYPGSLTVNNFGEVNETKGYMRIPLNEPHDYELKEFPEDTGTRWQHVELDLTDKDETALDEDSVREAAEGAIIKITVFAKKYGVVDETFVRGLFNKYGHVTRYETKVVGESGSTQDAPEKSVSHTKLLNEWLADEEDVSPKDRTAARKMGERIIAEVVG